MFWKLFKIHTTYDPFMDANPSGPPVGGGEPKRNKPNELDPIENPGRLKSEELYAGMMRQKVPFASDAQRILFDENYAQQRVLRKDIDPTQKKKARGLVKSNMVFLQAIVTLCACGVMCENWEGPSEASTTAVGTWTPLKHEHLYSYAKYFQVPKTENKDRAIADSRRAGTLTEDPPPVNLPHLQQVLTEVAKLGTTQCVVGDFRHFFYQHRISRWLSTLFGIACAEMLVRMVVLPMGWSWSPRLAQCSGWSILLYHDENSSTLGVKEKWGDDPPPMIKLRDEQSRVVGLIVLWIDNFIIFHKDQSVRDLWYNRIIKNCKKFDVQIKEIEKTSTPSYLGIYFETKRKGVVWRHDTKRTTKWQSLLTTEINTPRDVARLVGVGIWHHTVGLRPLLEMKNSINIMRRISKNIFTKAAWDKNLSELDIVLTGSEKQTLKEEVSKALLNRWVGSTFVAATRSIYAVTDAAKELVGDSGAGWVIFDEEGHVSFSDRIPWPKHHLEEDIHILELAAVGHCIHSIPKQQTMTHLILGCDNTVAVAALIKGYSSSDMICAMVMEIYKLCADKNLQLQILWIPSLSNAADPPSRNQTLSEKRNTASWELLQGAAPRTQRKGKRYRDLPFVEDDFESTYEYTQLYEEAILEEFSK